jgi:hypothetical protein
MKAQLKETSSMDNKRIWIVTIPDKCCFTFRSKKVAREFKAAYDVGLPTFTNISQQTV